MNNTFRSLNGSFALLALAVMHPLLVTSLVAGTLTVSTTNDGGNGSLRQAIQSAASGDTINFSVAGTITLTSGELLIAKNLSIAGPGASSLAVSGHTNGRVFEISSNAIVSISGLTIRDGHAADGAAAGARGTNGGGIYNAGTLALTSCTVSGNSGGNASTIFSASIGVGGAGGAGGGIYNIGNLWLTACTVSSNTAGFGGRGGTGGAGGTGGGIHNAGTLTLVDCTLSGNTAGASGAGFPVARRGVTGGAGGGLYNAGSLTLTACTVSGNRPGMGGPGIPGGDGGNGGGILNTGTSSSARLQNTLVALNSPGSGGVSNPFGGSRGNLGKGPNLFGGFTSGGHNLIGMGLPDYNSFGYSTGFTNGVQGDLVGSIDPLLGPLQENGGPTFTMALLAGSPALNAGDDAVLGAPFNLTTDQRGLPRKSGLHVDIGALEFQMGTLVAEALVQMLPHPQLPNQPFGLTVVAPTGTTGAIESSTDLNTWTTVANFTISPKGTYEFTDYSAAGLPQRFYRVAAP